MTPDLWAGSDAISASGGFDYAPPYFPPELLSFPPLGPLVPTRELRPRGPELQLLAGTHTVYAPVGATPYLLYINSVLRTAKWSIGREAATISMALGQWPNASFAIISTDGTYRPAIDDEVVIIDSSDGSRVFAGDIESPGEQHEDGTTIIWTQVRAVGYAARLDRRVFARHYDTNIIWTPRTMVGDILVNIIADLGISLGGGTDGAVFTTDVVLPWDTATNNIRRVLEPSGLDFFVDEHAKLHIVSKTVGHAAAPFNLADGDSNWDSNSMTVERERGRYANRIILLPDLREPGMWTDEFAGDAGIGTPQFYLTSYLLNEKPVVTVNGVTKRVGEFWASSGSVDFTYVPGGWGVNAVATYTSAHTIRVMYPSPLQPAVIAEDLTEQASYGRIVDAIVQIKDVYDRDRMVEIASGELARRMLRPYSISYRTQQQGLRPGQTQTINTTTPLVPNITVLIDSVSGTFEPRANNEGLFRWNIRGGNSAVLGAGSSVRTKQRIQELLMRPQDRHRQVFLWDIAKTVDGLTNDGTVAMTLHGSHEIARHGYIAEVRLRFDTAPTTNTIQVNVLKNGTTIFANSTYIEFRPADGANTVTKFDFSSVPLAVEPGDRLTAAVVTGDADAKDGILEVEQQG